MTIPVKEANQSKKEYLAILYPALAEIFKGHKSLCHFIKLLGEMKTKSDIARPLTGAKYLIAPQLYAKTEGLQNARFNSFIRKILSATRYEYSDFHLVAASNEILYGPIKLDEEDFNTVPKEVPKHLEKIARILIEESCERIFVVEKRSFVNYRYDEFDSKSILIGSGGSASTRVKQLLCLILAVRPNLEIFTCGDRDYGGIIFAKNLNDHFPQTISVGMFHTDDCEIKREIPDLEKYNLMTVTTSPFREIAQAILKSGWKGHINTFVNSAHIFQNRMNGHSKKPKMVKKPKQEIHVPPQVVANVNTIELGQDSLDTLKPGNWLDDMIVSVAMQFCQETAAARGVEVLVIPIHCFTVFRDSGRLMTFNRYQELFTAEIVFIPFCFQNHWWLGVKRQGSDNIEVFESLSSLAVFHRKDVSETFVEIFKAICVHTDQPARNWNVSYPDCSDFQQKNGSDCGMYLYMFANAISEGKQFDQNSIDLNRENLLRKIQTSNFAPNI